MKLECGINLGGYLSQCEHSMKHYVTFIQEGDLRQIARWGFDHVRLPIDYEVLEDEEGNTLEEGYAVIKGVLEWSKLYELNVVLDLHKAYGYDFNDAGNNEKNNLFSNESLQQRFLNLWAQIAVHFGHYDNVAFELLNEVVEKENAQAWNNLIRKTVTTIRQITNDTPVIYGGIQWNSVKTLKLLEVPMDSNTIFTFHFYEPLLFTHQKAHWVETMDKNKTIVYPGQMQDYRKESEVLGYQGEVVIKSHSNTMGEEFIREMVQEAVQAAANAGVGLYCGEFGVIDQAPLIDTLRWFKDVNTVFRENHIGCAVWNYKGMDFGFVDDHYSLIRGKLLDLWTDRK